MEEKKYYRSRTDLVLSPMPLIYKSFAVYELKETFASALLKPRKKGRDCLISARISLSLSLFFSRYSRRRFLIFSRINATRRPICIRGCRIRYRYQPQCYQPRCYVPYDATRMTLHAARATKRRRKRRRGSSPSRFTGHVRWGTCA